MQESQDTLTARQAPETARDCPAAVPLQALQCGKDETRCIANIDQTHIWQDESPEQYHP